MGSTEQSLDIGSQGGPLSIQNFDSGERVEVDGERGGDGNPRGSQIFFPSSFFGPRQDARLHFPGAFFFSFFSTFFSFHT